MKYLSYYMKFSGQVNFTIQKKNREIKVTRSDSHYVHDQERTSLLPLPTFTLITFFYFSEEFSV